MDRKRILLEESLREAACIGDIDAVDELLTNGIDPNARNDINGWTALHWAAKRGHKEIVSLLLENGADKTITTEKGETPLALATRPEVLALLGGDPGVSIKAESNLPITPSYLKNAPLAGKIDLSAVTSGSRRSQSHTMSSDNMNGLSNGQVQHSSNMIQVNNSSTTTSSSSDELVLKVRVAHCGDPDFIEVELHQNELTYYTLLRVCCEELGLTTSQVVRIRKLPDTLIRKDKDVQRLVNFQEIELVVSGQCGGIKAGPNGIIFPPNNANNGYQSIHLYKNQTILY